MAELLADITLRVMLLAAGPDYLPPPAGIENELLYFLSLVESLGPQMVLYWVVMLTGSLSRVLFEANVSL